MDIWLNIAVFAPLVGALGTLINPVERAAKPIVIASLGLSLLGVIIVGSQFDMHAGAPQFVSSYATLEQLGIALQLGVDGISLPLLGLSSFVGLIAAYISQPEAKVREYYVLLLLTVGSALGAFASYNLFFFYFFCELATVPKFLLVAAWGTSEGRDPMRTQPRRAALQLTLYITAGAFAVLLGLVALYIVAGQRLDMRAIAEYFAQHPLSVTAQTSIFTFLLLGFGVWASMFPFHGWVVPAYGSAPPAATLLFAGVIKNLGAYGLIRIGVALLPQGVHALSEVLAVLALINIVYGGFLAYRQTSWNRLVAYSAVSHAGYPLLGIATVSSIGVTGAVLFLVAHGVLMALLFLLVAHLQRQSDSKFETTSLKGLAYVMPFMAVCTVAAAMASSGMAGFANFASEMLVLVAAWSHTSPIIQAASAAGVFGIVLTAAYFLRAIRCTFFGPRPIGVTQAPRDVPLGEKIPIAALLLVLLVVGFYPRALTDSIQNTVVQMLSASDNALTHRAEQP